MQFPINNDLTTTGHKLQGMTKQYLIVSQLNYSTPNWIYVVLSRVTSLDGLFLLQPIKENYNPQPSKLLRDEWKNQRKKEIYQETFRTPNYFWFDLTSLEFKGFQLMAGKYEEIAANEQGLIAYYLYVITITNIIFAFECWVAWITDIYNFCS